MASSAVRNVKTRPLINHAQERREEGSLLRGHPAACHRAESRRLSFLAVGEETAVESGVGHSNSGAESCLLWFSTDNQLEPQL